MIDAIKKTLLAGVGAALVTKDKVEAALDDLVAQGKINAKDARDVAEKIARDGRREFDSMSKDLGGQFNKLAAESSREARAKLRDIEARLRQLEKKTGGGARKPAKARRKRSSRGTA